MAYPAIAIANAFLDVARKEGEALTPMKLLKLVYFAHGWNLAVMDEPLIDEEVEAWRYGPVVRSVYDAAKGFGNSGIQGKLKTPFGDVIVPPGNDEGLNALVNWIWKQYGHYSGIALSNHTHEPDTPWSQVVNQCGGLQWLPHGKDINTELMKSYFKQKLAQLQPAT